MVRKQVYIEDRQQAHIKRLARRRGVTEAQVIRQAIDGQADVSENRGRLDPAARDEALALMRRLRARRSARRRRRDWTREDLYAERLGRYGRRAG